MHFSKKSIAILSLISISFGYALLTVAVRLLSIGFAPFTQVYVRIGLAFLLTLVLFRKNITGKKLRKISTKDWFLLFLMGTVGYGLAVIFVTVGTLHAKLLPVGVITSTVPLFTFIYSLVFLRKHVNKSMFIFILLSVYGVSVIATKSIFPVISNFGFGEFCVLLYAAGTGCYAVSRRFISPTISNKEITVIVMFFAFASSLLSALIVHEQLSFSAFLQPVVLIGLGIGVFFNIFATYLENFAFQHVKPVIGTQLLMLESVFLLFIGYIFYNEHVLPIEFIGAFIVILSVIFTNQYTTEK